MSLEKLIDAMKCSSSTEKTECIKEKCPYYLKFNEKEKKSFTEANPGIQVSDSFFEGCDFEQMEADTIAELERLQRIDQSAKEGRI